MDRQKDGWMLDCYIDTWLEALHATRAVPKSKKPKSKKKLEVDGKLVREYFVLACTYVCTQTNRQPKHVTPPATCQKVR